jgi:DUF4097 and DUF4098 domain-containing protein YvlB
MKVTTNEIFFNQLLTAIVLCITASSIFAQSKAENKTNGFCSKADVFNSGFGGITNHELREITLPARYLLTVAVRRHGNISVRGEENRSEILVRACVQTWATSDEAARALSRSIRIGTDSIIRPETGTNENENIWSVSTVSFEILVPRTTNLNLSTWNGNISINEIEGDLQFKAFNGNLGLKNLAGDVRGAATNGNVGVVLSGNRWIGKGLNVETTNGSVDLIIPEDYAASLEAGTGMGNINGNIYQKVKTRSGAAGGGSQIRTDINGGGSPLRVRTAVGNISLSYSAKLR